MVAFKIVKGWASVCVLLVLIQLGHPMQPVVVKAHTNPECQAYFVVGLRGTAVANMIDVISQFAVKESETQQRNKAALLGVLRRNSMKFEEFEHNLAGANSYFRNICEVPGLILINADHGHEANRYPDYNITPDVHSYQTGILRVAELAEKHGVDLRILVAVGPEERKMLSLINFEAFEGNDAVKIWYGRSIRLLADHQRSLNQQLLTIDRRFYSCFNVTRESTLSSVLKSHQLLTPHGSTVLPLSKIFDDVKINVTDVEVAAAYNFLAGRRRLSAICGA